MENFSHDWYTQLGFLGLLLCVLFWVAKKYFVTTDQDREIQQNILDVCQEEKQQCLEQLACQRKEMIDMMKEHRAELNKMNERLVEVVENNTKAATQLSKIVEQCQVVARMRKD